VTLRKWLILGIVFSFLLVAAPAFAQQENAKQTFSIGIQQMDVYTANNVGQTLNSALSFVAVTCGGKGTMTIFGHLQSTNQAGKLLSVWLSMDGCSPMMVASFTPNAKGNGDFYSIIVCSMTCSMTSTNPMTCCTSTCCSGSHSLVITISAATAPGATLYITHAPIQLECP